MSGSSTLRASDADRGQVTDRLCHAAGEGRLSHDELEQRIGLAIAARTYGELDVLVADLPGPGAREPSGQTRPRWRAAGKAVAVIFALLLPLGGATSGHGNHPYQHGNGAAVVVLALVVASVMWLRRRRRKGGVLNVVIGCAVDPDDNLRRSTNPDSAWTGVDRYIGQLTDLFDRRCRRPPRAPALRCGRQLRTPRGGARRS
jgi:hypothetical protein